MRVEPRLPNLFLRDSDDAGAVIAALGTPSSVAPLIIFHAPLSLTPSCGAWHLRVLRVLNLAFINGIVV